MLGQDFSEHSRKSQQVVEKALEMGQFHGESMIKTLILNGWHVSL